MGPRISWIMFGLTFLVSQNVFSRKIDPSRKNAMTAEPGKKAIIGNIDLMKISKSVKPKDCRDVGKKCQKADKHSCLLNFQYMFEKCKLTCRFCSTGKKTKKCKDLNPKCKRWSRHGDCLHYVAFMKDNCKKSCQLCGPGNHNTDNDERCPIWAKRGICHIKTHEMLDLCPYSCNKYKRRRIPVYTPPNPNRSRNTTRAHPAVRPTQAPTRPTPKLTEEQKDNEKGAIEERKEEEKIRMEEKKEQEKEKDEANLPHIVPVPQPTLPALAQQPAPVPAPATQPAPIPAPATQPVPIPAPALASAPAPYPQDDANTETGRENETGDVAANDGTNDETKKTNSEKKKVKSKLLVVIGESKSHLKKRKTSE